MKKLIFLIALIAAAYVSRGQFTEIKLSRDNVLINNYDLSKLKAADTSFIFKISKSVANSWGIGIKWTGVTGVGSISPNVTLYDDLSGFVPYAGPLITAITGTTGADAWEDSMFSWTYLKITVTKGTLSAGRLFMKLNIN